MRETIGTDNRHVVNVGITSEVAADSLDRAALLLAGIGGGAERAMSSALKRAAATGKTAAKRAVTREYAISQSDFSQNTQSRRHVATDSPGSLTVEFGFAGYVIPLLKFDTKAGQDGRIVTRVKRQNAAEALNHAFFAQMPGNAGHRGVYEREQQDRFPVRELYGPATPQMMYANEAVTGQIDRAMAETYAKRIEQEILRIMNGWGA